MASAAPGLRTLYHYPSRCLYCPRSPPSGRLVLLLLNQPLKHADSLFMSLWRRADLRICADGAANRLYDSFHSPTATPSSSPKPLKSTDSDTAGGGHAANSESTIRKCADHDSDPKQATTRRIEQYIPDGICGDMDSIRPDVSQYFAHRGTEINHVRDQDTTDFMKCLNWIDQLQVRHGWTDSAMTVIAYGNLGGRLDQTMSSLYVLFNFGASKQIYLANPESITFLLPKGKNQIECDWYKSQPACGIIPLGVSSATVTTTGLRWNLDNTETSFNGLLSTSNIPDAPEIVVDTSEPVIWTIELK
ncbi:cAMP-dependent protein kinase subunit [Dimargaris cristalligena]|nr:cAMP-dependent protein kinase subunit [Dimargaris cristalligena]